jgi:hypothetical protein
VDIKKLALVMAFAFVITGIVVYQVRAARGVQRAATPIGGSSAAPAAPAPATGSPDALPSISTAGAQGEVPKPAVETHVLSIPTSGWGRSPFLTVEEIAKLNEPVAPAPVIEPAPPAPVVEASLPKYTFSGTSYGGRNRNAIAWIDGQPYQTGDRIGKEVVTEIKEESVTLESNGKSRKLSR